jgi:hypothetical protein
LEFGEGLIWEVFTEHGILQLYNTELPIIPDFFFDCISRMDVMERVIGPHMACIAFYDEAKTFVVICRLFVKHIVMIQTPHETLVCLML